MIRKNDKSNGIRKLYISGPMSGLPDYNMPMFNKVAAELRAKGNGNVIVYNPAEQDAINGTDPADAVPNGKLRKQVIKADLDYILTEATELVVLKGWRQSSGCVCEVMTARAIGISVRFYRERKPAK
jgi:hypothetical protein